MIAVAGQAASPPTPAPVVTVAVASPVVRAPAATPSPRSDWPAAIGQHRAAADPRPREEGTDGLMGRLPFGLPSDTPTVRIEWVNRFTLDDVRTSWASPDSTPPWVRRLGGLENFRTDPFER